MAQQQQREELSVDVGALSEDLPQDAAAAEGLLELLDVPEEEDPIFRAGRWVIADRRSGCLETEPGKSNAARARTLQALATRLRLAVAAEEGRLLKLQKSAESEPLFRALGRLRQRRLHAALEHRLRSHKELVTREVFALMEVFGHFDPRSIHDKTGGPALRLLDALSASVSAPSAAPAGRPRVTGDRQRADSGASSDAKAKGAVVPGDDRDAAKTEACAATVSSSEETVRMAAEQVAAGMAAGLVATDEMARRMSPVPWRHFPFGKMKTQEGTSSSSSGSRSTDSLLEKVAALQETGAGACTAVDTLIASVDEPAESAATELMVELQRHFAGLGDVLHHQFIICDLVLKNLDQRALPAEGEDQGLLSHDLALLVSQMQIAQASVCRTEASLHQLVSELPPAPPLSPTPPYSRPRTRFAAFQAMFKAGFWRRE